MRMRVGVGVGLVGVDALVGMDEGVYRAGRNAIAWRGLRKSSRRARGGRW